MPELDLVYEGKVKHSGIFDFREIYNFLYDWFKSYGYLVIEDEYGEKIKPEGKDIEVAWTCLRKVSDYFRFRIKAHYRVLRLVTVEIERNGVKLQSNKGDLDIKFSAFLERDYEKKWETNPMFKFARAIYDKYIIKKRIREYQDRIAAEVDEVIAQTKAQFGLIGTR